MDKIDLGKLSINIYNRAKTVHRIMGPGLPSNAYIQGFLHDLRLEGVQFQRDFEIPLFYGQIRLQEKIFANILVESVLLINFSEDTEITRHDLEFMKASLKYSGKPGGVIIAFKTEVFSGGFKKIFNDNL